MRLSHAAAIKTDGSLWTWGRNGRGQLGDGTFVDRDSPVHVMDHVVSVAAAGQQYNIVGSDFTLAVQEDGSLWCWGADYGATPRCVFRGGEWLEDNAVFMHRLYNRWSGEHFYTADEAERDGVVAAGWTYEGVGWNAPLSGDPVYRLYNPYAGEHHYTLSAGERDALVSAGWADEGVGWYSDPGESVPLYREYNPNMFSCNHNYTTDRAEHDALVALGWRDEGVAWYGV